MGLAQTDIKKVLAYSTVSQLGYMFLGCGALAFGWACSTSSLTPGSRPASSSAPAPPVIHAMSGEQEMTKMGGLKDLIPHTYRTMLISTLAIAGVPFLSGFFSKDAILAETFISGHPVLLGARGTDGWVDRLLHVPTDQDDVLRRVPGNRGTESMSTSHPRR